MVIEAGQPTQRASFGLTALVAPLKSACHQLKIAIEGLWVYKKMIKPIIDWSLNFIRKNSIFAVTAAGLIYGATGSFVTMKACEFYFGVALSPTAFYLGMAYGATKSCLTFLFIRWGTVNDKTAVEMADSPSHSTQTESTSQINSQLQNNLIESNAASTVLQKRVEPLLEANETPTNVVKSNKNFGFWNRVSYVCILPTYNTSLLSNH